MKRSTRWYERTGKVARALMLAMLLTLLMCLPGAAWAMAQHPPPPPPEQGDPELAAIARDIILLRMINQMALTRDQTAKLIPELEALLRDEQALRRDVKALMLEQRRALLKGQVPEAKLEASRRKIKQRTDKFRDRVRKRLEALSNRLTPEQTRHLHRLVLTGPGLWRHGMRGAAMPGPMGPGPRRGLQRRMAPPGGQEMGPSARVLERVIALLKEKLKVMPK